MRAEVSKPKIAAVLIGFPLVSTLISLLLLERGSLAWTGLEFFTAFWLLVTAWYATQIFLLSRVLKSSGWRWSDIGYGFDRRRTLWFVGGSWPSPSRCWASSITPWPARAWIRTR